MKNKHLVLIFLVTVLVGVLLARFWPLKLESALEKDLLLVDTTQAKVLKVVSPGYPPWSLHKGEGSWTMLVDHRPFPLSEKQTQALLSAAAHVRSLKALKTEGLDSLGLSVGQYTTLSWELENGEVERINIGREADSGTWVQVPKQPGAAFLASGELRSLFAVDARKLRSNTILDWRLTGLDSLVFVNRVDSTICYLGGAMPDSVGHWLSSVLPTGAGSFADYFDESSANELVMARLSMFRKGKRADIELYRWIPPNLPEDLDAVWQVSEVIAPYAWHSSTNPLNYFALSDTLRANAFLAGPPMPVACDTLRYED